MKKITITYGSGMVNINGEDFSYGEILKMYKGDKSGYGLQINEGMDEEKMKDMCFKISEIIKEKFKESL